MNDITCRAPSRCRRRRQDAPQGRQVLSPGQGGEAAAALGTRGAPRQALKGRHKPPCASNCSGPYRRPGPLLYRSPKRRSCPATMQVILFMPISRLLFSATGFQPVVQGGEPDAKQASACFLDWPSGVCGRPRGRRMDESAFGKRAEACFDVVSPLANPQLKLGAKGQSRLKPAENSRECLVPCHSGIAPRGA